MNFLPIICQSNTFATQLAHCTLSYLIDCKDIISRSQHKNIMMHIEKCCVLLLTNTVSPWNETFCRMTE